MIAKRFAICTATAFIVLLAATFAPADLSDSNVLDRIAGEYQVNSTDIAGEKFTGSAVVRKDGTASVYYKRLATTRIYALKSTSITADGDLYTITFKGILPQSAQILLDKRAALANPVFSMYERNSSPTHALDLPGLELPVDQQQVTVTTGGATVSFESAGPQHKPTSDTIEVRLRYRPDNIYYPLLSGTWRIYVDPLTWLDANGAGRAGYMGRDPTDHNICAIAGSEEWLRAKSPCRLQLFAKCAGNLKKIEYLYAGVPAVVEATFEDSQDDSTKLVTVTWGPNSREVKVFRQEDDHRVFLSEPFIPSDPSVRPQQPQSPPRAKDSN
jgi:hypothetical protein